MSNLGTVPPLFAEAENYLLRHVISDVWYIRMGEHSCCVGGTIGFS